MVYLKASIQSLEISRTRSWTIAFASKGQSSGPAEKSTWLSTSPEATTQPRRDLEKCRDAQCLVVWCCWLHCIMHRSCIILMSTVTSCILRIVLVTAAQLLQLLILDLGVNHDVRDGTASVQRPRETPKQNQ